MKKNKKTKKQVIVVPSAKVGTKKTKSASLTKPRSVHSKEKTLAYYNCLIDKVANSSAKITQLCRDCKGSKEEVARTQVEHKRQLVKEVAQNYKAFGESLGHYLHADIVGCAKELRNKSNER